MGRILVPNLVAADLLAEVVIPGKGSTVSLLSDSVPGLRLPWGSGQLGAGLVGSAVNSQAF